MAQNGIQQALRTEDWVARKAAYSARVAPWVQDRTNRASRNTKHPVLDFLFEYYFQRPGHLLRWSPGYGVLLTGAQSGDVTWPQFQSIPQGLILPLAKFPVHRRNAVEWAIQFLHTTFHREPFFGCFGLHEWAMVYSLGEVRHEKTPLRLTREEINSVVERGVLQCTHYDAFRFFSPKAVPLNRISLTPQETMQHDQSGCVHANMDLYKLAFGMSPFIPAEYVADGFELALAARELDMRASPYDLTHLGYRPIKIETKRGREEYVEGQKNIHAQAQPLRYRLWEWYVKFADSRGWGS
jgi:hypothetical protein